MKNNQTNLDLSTLAAQGSDLDFLLAEVNGTATVKKLRTRGPRKGETLNRPQSGGRPVDMGMGAAGGGQWVPAQSRWAGNGQCGQGRQMVSDLTAVQANYQKMLRSDAARADRAQEAANRRAERDAATQDALDALLASI